MYREQSHLCEKQSTQTSEQVESRGSFVWTRLVALNSSSESMDSYRERESGHTKSFSNDSNISVDSDFNSSLISSIVSSASTSPTNHRSTSASSQSSTTAQNSNNMSNSNGINASGAASTGATVSFASTPASSALPPTHPSTPIASTLSNPPIVNSIYTAKSPALTQSMSDSARIDPKPFPYQPSKDDRDRVAGEEEWAVIEATPADPRFENECVHVQVSSADAVYQLKPIHCGRNVVFMNAQDPAFYKRELRSPALTVWILCGLSISQSHALKRLFESGWRQNIQIKVMEINKFELVASKEGLENILYEGAPCELPDCILNRVGSNVSYFGLAVIRQLENMGCLILNTLRSIEISRDKLLTVQTLAVHGLPIPKTILAKFPVNLDTIAREFDYPIIIKKVSGSQGKGIMKVDSHSQLEDLVDMLDTNKPLLFQEFISASSGKDLRVFVIGGRVVGAMMRIASKGNFKANVHQGATVKPVKISPQVEWLVLETVKIVGLDIAGVDLLIDKNTYKICEVNSSPGFEGLEKATGENIAIKMFLYMKMRLGVWRRGKSSKSLSSITVPIHEDAVQDEEAAANGNGNNAPESSSSSQTDKQSEADKFRTIPRNRSIKRSTERM